METNSNIIIIPKFTLLSYFIKKPIFILYAAVPPIVLTPVVDFEASAWVLFILFIFDLITGILASYFEWKKIENKKDKWFFGKGEGFNSDKFKKMFVKGIVYMLTPMVANKFQTVYFLKNIKYEKISDAEITVATFLILIFCINEGFSIFHENLPKCGFNIIERIKKIAKLFYSTKKSITDED